MEPKVLMKLVWGAQLIYLGALDPGGGGPLTGTLTRWMLVPLMLPLLSMRKMNSPWVFLRFGCADWRSGQKLSMITEWWGMSLWRRFRMISVWRRKEYSHLGNQEVQHCSCGLTLVPYYSPSIVKPPLTLCLKGFQDGCTWLLCLLDFHRLQQQAWTLETESLRFDSQLCDLEQVPPLGLFLCL